MTSMTYKDLRRDLGIKDGNDLEILPTPTGMRGILRLPTPCQPLHFQQMLLGPTS